MITGPLFKCFGSKWLSGKSLPPPLHGTIVEPFAGGAGYALRHYDHSVVLYERDNHVRELWQYLINEATESEIRDIPVDIPVGTDIRSLGLTHGASLLLKHWQRTNNVGTCWTVSPWGNASGQWTANKRARISEEHAGVRHWKVCGSDWSSAFADESGPATWFVDPPYEFNYRYRQPPIDYNDLAASVMAASGQAIVCEAICPKTGKSPSWLPFSPWKEVKTSRNRSTTSSKELLFQNLT